MSLLVAGEGFLEIRRQSGSGGTASHHQERRQQDSGRESGAGHALVHAVEKGPVQNRLIPNASDAGKNAILSGQRRVPLEKQFHLVAGRALRRMKA